MRRRLFFGAVALVATGFRKLFTQPTEPAITMAFSGKDLPQPLRQGVAYHVSVEKAGSFQIVTTPDWDDWEPIEIWHKEPTNGNSNAEVLSLQAAIPKHAATEDLQR